MPLQQSSPIDAGPRLAALLGTLAALLLAGLAWYPAEVYPLQSLLLGTGMLVMGAGLAASAWRRNPAALATPPVLAAGLLAFWGLARLAFTAVPALGRDFAVGLCWLGIAAMAGATLGAACGASSNIAATVVRRGLTLFAMIAAAMAAEQYFVGYARTRAELGAAPAADLETQSLLHALELRRVGGQLGNPNLLAAQLSVLAVFAIGTFGERGKWRWIGAVAWLAASGALMLTGSRGGTLTFMLASLAGVLMLQRGRKKIASPAIAGLFAAGLCAAGAPAAAQGLLSRLAESDTIRERLFYWSIAWRVFQRSPLVGEGPGGFERLYPILKSPLAHESQYAHSWLFQYGADLGLIGLALIAFFFGALALRLLRAKGEARWLLLAPLVLCFNGLFEFSLQWRWFLIACGFLAGLGTALQGNLFRKPFPKAWLALCLSVVAAVGALWIGGRMDLAALARSKASDARWEGDWPAYAQSMADALRWTPDNGAYQVEYAGALARTGRDRQAKAALREAARLNPDSAAAHAAMAQMLASENDSAASLLEWAEAIRRYPTKVDYRLARAALLLNLNRIEEARPDLLAIEAGQWPVWEFQREGYNALRERAGLKRIAW